MLFVYMQMHIHGCPLLPNCRSPNYSKINLSLAILLVRIFLRFVFARQILIHLPSAFIRRPPPGERSIRPTVDAVFGSAGACSQISLYLSLVELGTANSHEPLLYFQLNLLLSYLYSLSYLSFPSFSLFATRWIIQYAWLALQKEVARQ
jgi:hypothetical protein